MLGRPGRRRAERPRRRRGIACTRSCFRPTPLVSLSPTAEPTWPKLRELADAVAVLGRRDLSDSFRGADTITAERGPRAAASRYPRDPHPWAYPTPGRATD